jgi:hypothetical protein
MIIKADPDHKKSADQPRSDAINPGKANVPVISVPCHHDPWQGAPWPDPTISPHPPRGIGVGNS